MEGLHVESYDQFDECDREKYTFICKEQTGRTKKYHKNSFD